jgi:hypothetical protein
MPAGAPADRRDHRAPDRRRRRLAGADPSTWHYAGRAANGIEFWTEPTSTDAATSALYAVSSDGQARYLAAIDYTMDVNPTGTRTITPVSGPGDGTRFRVIDLVDGGDQEYEVAPPGRSCRVVGWFDADRALLFCLDTGTEVGDVRVRCGPPAHPSEAAPSRSRGHTKGCRASGPAETTSTP